MTNKELQQLLKQYPEDKEMGIFRYVEGYGIMLCADPKINDTLGILTIE